MEIIAKISKGSVMDQVYLPKNRSGLTVGSFVVIKPLKQKTIIEKPFFYGIKKLEPIKIKIIEEIFEVIDELIESYDNVIVTGSFLDEGFNFDDVDVLVVSEEQINELIIKKEISSKTGIKPHLMVLDNKTLLRGLSSDPLYQSMLSKCVSKKRIIYYFKPLINYKILDLNLLKSKNLIDNFEILSGKEKYYLTRNLISILLFLEKGKISKEQVDNRIKELFNLESVDLLKNNLVEKKEFLKKYDKIYNETFDRIMQNIKNGSK
ncbi:hypothetical protein HZA97_01515 [Candidatus Woesearchaeota archaeon]|nr:hypothetical protein [Candidatus Woesearchaeota archaeon]